MHVFMILLLGSPKKLLSMLVLAKQLLLMLKLLLMVLKLAILVLGVFQMMTGRAGPWAAMVQRARAIEVTVSPQANDNLRNIYRSSTSSVNGLVN